MSDLKIVEWLEDSDEIDEFPISVGWMGGWVGTRPDPEDESEFPRSLFDGSHRWKDYLEYLETINPKDDLYIEPKYPLVDYIEVIRKEVLKHKLRWTGAEHQAIGIPKFSDGTVGVFSYRAWGDLMAAIWSEEEDKDYSYMDFYC